MVMETSRLHDDAYRRDVIEGLWREHHMGIRQYCLTWLGSGLAEEMTQEVFFAAWQGLPRYRQSSPIRTWLYGIAHNKCRQAYRNRTRRSTIAQTFLEEIRERAHAEDIASPEQHAAEVGQLKQLYESLAKLSNEDRILLNLRYWRDLPMKDIANIVGKSVPTLRKRLARAEQRLRELM